MIVSPSRYQKDAKDNALSIFRYALQQIEVAPDEANRRQAAAYNGCVLIEAPTGSGKTMMAGMIAEEFAREAKIVWFWFTPFAGLVDQASIALKKQFGGLRVRDIQGDRLAMGTKSGDVFVSTWAAVAANNEKARRLRRDGDLSLSLDFLIPSLRELGFHIGVVVDEAHHTFGSATEAVRFYTEVMQPEFTLLITATPDDKDVDKFKRTTGIAELHRITVSRQDAVDAGMIKAGIKSVAYLAPDDQKALVDFRMAALADAKAVHERIKQELQAAGINLMPLMLVQVATTEKDDDVAQARAVLMQLGFREDAIASYTSKEPSDDLLAVALDETKEVLIFKMAVALGFDAPRAFTLVSMRGARDTDFGIQVVGRILRVHRRLQGREVSELLRNGYVFLADAENQSGLTSAGEKINSLRTGLSDISPYTMVVNIAGQNQVQVVKNGQSTMLPVAPQSPAIPNTAQDSNIPVYAVTGSLSNGMQNVLEGFVMALPSAQTEQTQRIVAELSGATRFSLKQSGLKFKTEFMPLGTDALLACIGGKVALGDRELSEGRRAKTTVIRREEEIFTRSITDTQYQARISESEIARRAQRVLFEPDYLDPRDLHAVLIRRLKSEYEARGWDYDERELELVLDLVLAAFPSLIRQSARECAAQYAELKDTAPLPDVIELPAGARTSRLNVYGVMPPDLNRDELAFAEMLDADLSCTVEWWHRNEPRKPWSVGLILPNGAQYFPDLVVKVNGRAQGGGLLLIEIKGDHILNSGDTLDKVLASHQLYKRPVMLMREDSGRFMTIRQDTNGKNSPDQIFRLDLMVGY